MWQLLKKYRPGRAPLGTNRLGCRRGIWQIWNAEWQSAPKIRGSPAICIAHVGNLRWCLRFKLRKGQSPFKQRPTRKFVDPR